jgi:putative FmdB family regulatory protein
MPTYEYACRECGYGFEEIQSIKAEPLVTCPNCGKNSLKRLLGTGAGLIFKGNGFYITDYKKNGKPSTEKRSDKPEAPQTKSSDKKEKKTDDPK